MTTLQAYLFACVIMIIGQHTHHFIDLIGIVGMYSTCIISFFAPTNLQKFFLSGNKHG